MQKDSKKLARLAAAAAALLLAGVAGSAFAHPDKGGEKVQKIIILKEGPAPEGGKGETHTFRIERRGPGGPGVHVFQFDGKEIACADGDKVVEHSEGDDKKKTKVLICDKGGDPAMRAKHLEEALERINSNEHLTAETKARITASLREALERTRNAP
jgi:hypothetical protein